MKNVLTVCAVIVGSILAVRLLIFSIKNSLVGPAEASVVYSSDAIAGSATLEIRESLLLKRHSGVGIWLDKVCDTETGYYVYVTHQGGVSASRSTCE